MNLEEYTDEQLKAELKRRSEKARAEREKVARCRNCVHMFKSGIFLTAKCKISTYKLRGREVAKVVKPSNKACEKYKKVNP